MKNKGYSKDISKVAEIPQNLIEDKKQLQPKEENIYEHIRKGKPGDYLNKLQPETIEYLNNKFSPIFETYHDVLNIMDS